MKMHSNFLRPTAILLGVLASMPMIVFASKAPWLGVVIDEVNFQQLEEAGLDYGVKVMDVIDGSPAMQTGLREGDILVEFNEKPVYSVDQLQWLMSKSEVNETLTIGFERGAERKTAKVTLGDAQTAHQSNSRDSHPTVFGSYLGVQLQELNEGLREIFSVPVGEGMLVTKVEESSAASQSGIKVGDVIVGMASKRVEGMADIQRVLDFFDPGESISVNLVRNKQALDLQVTLGSKEIVDELGWSTPEHDFSNWFSVIDPHHHWNHQYLQQIEFEQMMGSHSSVENAYDGELWPQLH